MLKVNESGVLRIPANRKTIREGEFFGRKDIKRVILPKGLKTIKDFAFADCYNLSSIDFSGWELESIGIAAFSKCFKLTTVSIPLSVRRIGELAFDNCQKLTRVTLPKHARVAEDAFLHCHPDLKEQFS